MSTIAIGLTGLTLVLLGVRLMFGERPLDYTGPRAILDAVFAVILLCIVLMIAFGVGRKVLRWLQLAELSTLEQVVFGVPMGLGVLAYGVLALGLIGALRVETIAAWLVIAGIWTWREWLSIFNMIPEEVRRGRQIWTTLRLWQRLLLIAIGFVGATAMLHALTPPWDYDGLMYHLQGPRLFLQAGRIVVLPDVWQANGPSTIEMLFLTGLAFGTDPFAKLIHLAYGTILLLAIYAFGRRWISPVGGWLAVALVLGIPILPLYAGFAYADLAWAVYVFLALMALQFWTRDHQRGWLVLAGLMAGWALGSKYLALGGVAVLALWVLVHSRTSGGRTLLARVATFGGIAALIGAPWYLKNWLLAGNPVYPLYWGGVAWPTDRLGLLSYYLDSFGVRQTVSDYALLPINVFLQYGRFTTFEGNIEFLSPLFALALLYPWVRRPQLNGVAGVTALSFVVWAAGSQQIRFLLPVFPMLSVITSAVLLELYARSASRKWLKLIGIALVSAFVVVTVVYQIIFFATVQPLGVIAGTESKDQFLNRNLHDTGPLRFVQSNLPLSARVLMLWNGRGYYCDARCVPDTEQSRWTRLVRSARTVPAVADALHAAGITHLWFSREDLMFLSGHDPAHWHQMAADFFSNEFQPRCTHEVYRDEWAVLFEVTCR